VGPYSPLGVDSEGVLDEYTAYPLNVPVHLDHFTMVTSQAVQFLLEGTRGAFEQRWVYLILQERDASRSDWLRQVLARSYARLMTANSVLTATGD
jgi:hypothetical protein